MYKNAAYQVGNLVVPGASNITVAPLFSDQAYTAVCIACLPLGSGSFSHTIDLYLDGIIKETHDYPVGTRQSTHFIYKDQIFPPNVGLKTSPQMNGFEPASSIGLTIRITNNEAENREFSIYSTFEMFVGTVCRRLTFNEIRR